MICNFVQPIISCNIKKWRIIFKPGERRGERAGKGKGRGEEREGRGGGGGGGGACQGGEGGQTCFIWARGLSHGP